MKITDVETILLCYRYEQDEKWKWSGPRSIRLNLFSIIFSTAH